MEAADGWQILFYRSLAFALAMLGFVGAVHRARTATAFRAVGAAGLVVALSLGAGFISFIFALLHTTVANVVFILSAAPFFAALFAWLALGEPVRRRTVLAVALALVGTGVMLGEGLIAGALTGNLLALVSCLCYAVGLVALRKGRGVDMAPATCLAGLVAMVVSVAFVDSFRLAANDLALAVALGVVQLGMQYILVTIGSRHVPAAEVALLTRIQMVLAPLWVWLGFGEVPSALSLVGGTILLGAVGGHAAVSLRRA